MLKLIVSFYLFLPYILPLENEMFLMKPDLNLKSDCQCKSSYGIGKDADPNQYVAPGDNEPLPKNCLEIMKKTNVSGIYWIQPTDAKPFRVLCDMDIWDGGWTHIQKRYDGSEDFYLLWKDYKHGFGYLNKEHWLGLESLYALARHQAVELLVELTDHNGDNGYAHYDFFQIGSELEGYKLSVISGFKGDAGDALSSHIGMEFTTRDMDRDENKDENCAVKYLGAWWYKSCYWCNLNGKFINMNLPQQYWGQGVQWYSFKNISYVHPHSKVRMLVRPAHL